MLSSTFLYKENWTRTLANQWKATGSSGATYQLARPANERDWILWVNGVPYLEKFSDLEDAIGVVDDTEQRVYRSRQARGLV